MFELPHSPPHPVCTYRWVHPSVGSRSTIVFAGAIVPRTSQYGAAVLAVTSIADVIVTGASVAWLRSSPVTAEQSITGVSAGSTANPFGSTGRGWSWGWADAATPPAMASAATTATTRAPRSRDFRERRNSYMDSRLLGAGRCGEHATARLRP